MQQQQQKSDEEFSRLEEEREGGRSDRSTLDSPQGRSRSIHRRVQVEELECVVVSPPLLFFPLTFESHPATEGGEQRWENPSLPSRELLSPPCVLLMTMAGRVKLAVRKPAQLPVEAVEGENKRRFRSTLSFSDKMRP